MTPPPDDPQALLRTQLMAALQAVQDPEIGESIVDLGLLHSLTLSERCARAVLIPTSATCPMVDVLIDDTEAALRDACPADWTIEVDVDWDTPWDPSQLAPALKARFGW